MREEESEGRNEGEGGEIEAFRTLNSPAASPLLDNPSRSSAHHHRSGVEGVRPWSHVYGNHGNRRVVDVDVVLAYVRTRFHPVCTRTTRSAACVLIRVFRNRGWEYTGRAIRAKARPQMTFARGWEYELHDSRGRWNKTRRKETKSGINGGTSSRYEYILSCDTDASNLCAPVKHFARSLLVVRVRYT